MIGERIHSYEVTAHLGQGGMGNVFRATDSMLGREVALKMLHPQLTMQPQFLERFKKEARILAQLLHPNIAVIYNFIEQQGNHFMVMEYVEGTSLDDLLKKYRVLPAEFVVPVFIQALEGLQHAHRKNIWHRDIKPANLMITEDGTLKLMDFGIAKVAGEQKMTQVNKIVGTIEFMAPELIEGKEASALSDIYAMGATLYELVSGKIPFEGDTDFNIMQAILKSKVKPPEKLNPSVPKALSDIVLKAMDKNPEHRYPTARAFQSALTTAFPHYREINENVLRKAQQTVYAARRTGELVMPTRMMSDPPSTETRVELSKPLASLQLYKKKILSNKKLAILVGCLLVVVIGIFALIGTSSNKSDATATLHQDSVPRIVKNVSAVNNGESNIVPTGDNTRLPQPGNNVPVISGPVDDRNDIPMEGESPKAATKNAVIISQAKSKKNTKNEAGKDIAQKPVENNATDPVVEPKPVEKVDIVIGTEIIVNLTLIGTPDMNQEKKQEQRVSFLVTRPVYYGKTLIIKQGARATGSLTIGRRRTDIEINEVEGANGMRIPLKSERAHGKRDDIESHNTFNAFVQQGTRMSF